MEPEICVLFSIQTDKVKMNLHRETWFLVLNWFYIDSTF